MYDFQLVCHCKYDYLVPFLSYLTLNNIVTLKSRLGVIRGNWKWHHSIVFLEKWLIFHTPLHLTYRIT